MLRDHFGPDFTCIGIDINPSTKKFESADWVHIHIGDSADVAFWQGIKAMHPKVDVFLDAAVAYWSSVDASAATRLSEVSVQVADLPGALLGLASESTRRIWIDTNAAGHGLNLLLTQTHPEQQAVRIGEDADVSQYDQCQQDSCKARNLHGAPFPFYFPLMFTVRTMPVRP